MAVRGHRWVEAEQQQQKAYIKQDRSEESAEGRLRLTGAEATCRVAPTDSRADIHTLDCPRDKRKINEKSIDPRLEKAVQFQPRQTSWSTCSTRNGRSWNLKVERSKTRENYDWIRIASFFLCRLFFPYLKKAFKGRAMLKSLHQHCWSRVFNLTYLLNVFHDVCYFIVVSNNFESV